MSSRSEKRFKCQKGFHQNPPRSRKCVPKTQKISDSVMSSDSIFEQLGIKQNRCPKGTRRNKQTRKCEANNKNKHSHEKAMKQVKNTTPFRSFSFVIERSHGVFDPTEVGDEDNIGHKPLPLGTQKKIKAIYLENLSLKLGKNVEVFTFNREGTVKDQHKRKNLEEYRDKFPEEFPIVLPKDFPNLSQVFHSLINDGENIPIPIIIKRQELTIQGLKKFAWSNIREELKNRYPELFTF